MQPSKRILWKRDGDHTALRHKLDEATARLAASVVSIAGDRTVDKNAMLARTFGQFQEHVNKLLKRQTPLADIALLHAVFKNDNERSEPDLSDSDAGMPDRRGRRRRDDEAARLASQMDTDADHDHEDENDDATDDERVEKGMRTMESAQLTALFKRHGFETIAKCNIEKPFLSEFEMTEVGKQEAAARGVSFATLYEGSVTLRKAVTSCRDAQWAKAGQGQLMPLMPTQVGGADARDVDAGSEGKAYQQLLAMAQRMKEASPERKLSDAQWFESVYNDPANVELKRREREEAHARLPVSGGRIPI
jgi:hypothetical protein